MFLFPVTMFSRSRWGRGWRITRSRPLTSHSSTWISSPVRGSWPSSSTSWTGTRICIMSTSRWEEKHQSFILSRRKVQKVVNGSVVESSSRSQDCGGFIWEWKLWVSKKYHSQRWNGASQIIKKKNTGIGQDTKSVFRVLAVVLAWFLLVWWISKVNIGILRVSYAEEVGLWCWCIQRSIFGTLRSFLLFWCEFLTNILSCEINLSFIIYTSLFSGKELENLSTQSSGAGCAQFFTVKRYFFVKVLKISSCCS